MLCAICLERYPGNLALAARVHMDGFFCYVYDRWVWTHEAYRGYGLLEICDVGLGRRPSHVAW